MSHDNNNNNNNNLSFKDSFTSHSPFLSNNLPNKFSAKHLKLLSFLKWFYDNNLNLPDFYDTHASLNFLHRFLDFESQFTKRFKSFLKLNKKPTNTNTNTNTNTTPLYLSNTTNSENEKNLIDTEIININDTDYLINITDNIIYDIKTHEKVGTYDSNQEKIII